MTVKDLARIVLSPTEEQSANSNKEMQQLLQKLRDRPFYIWGSEKHRSASNYTRGLCCFNHIIGLPQKNGISQPLWSYEDMLYRALMIPGYINSSPSILPTAYSAIEKRDKVKQIDNAFLYPFKLKHLWVKKATGLGVTEFMLRLMAWLCLRNDDYKKSQMVIVTGPNQELAIKMIKRLKGLFEPHGITFESKETVINLNGCEVQAYPSNHIDAFRSLTNPKFILLDEADFFRKGEQEEVRHVAERYIAKSDPFIVMVSTPNRPDGLFAEIEKEGFDTCIYKKVFLDYTYGLGKIYTTEEIEKAAKSPSFPREYELQYRGLIGNVFSTQSIENCQKIPYSPDPIIPSAKVSIGVDPAFGSSKFSICVTRFANERIEVIEAEEYDRPDFNEMINKIWQISQQHGGKDNTTIFTDAANPVIWKALKQQFNEPYSESYVFEKLAYYKKNNLDPAAYMAVVPVPFSTYGAQLLQNAKSLVEDKDNLVAIDKRFDKLLTALRTAVANEYRLDKEATSYNDTMDAFRLSLMLYKRSNK